MEPVNENEAWLWYMHVHLQRVCMRCGPFLKRTPRYKTIWDEFLLDLWSLAYQAGC